jgi:hypothetical protein
LWTLMAESLRKWRPWFRIFIPRVHSSKNYRWQILHTVSWTTDSEARHSNFHQRSITWVALFLLYVSQLIVIYFFLKRGAYTGDQSILSPSTKECTFGFSKKIKHFVLERRHLSSLSSLQRTYVNLNLQSHEVQPCNWSKTLRSHSRLPLFASTWKW